MKTMEAKRVLLRLRNNIRRDNTGFPGSGAQADIQQVADAIEVVLLELMNRGLALAKAERGVAVPADHQIGIADCACSACARSSP